MQAYYNGVAAAIAQGATTVDAPLATGKPWMMGKVDHTAFGGTFLFSGLLDEVVIYDRVLTAAEIAALEALGTTLYVDDDGVVGFDGSCDGTEAIAYTTIQAAVNAASAGNTVNVCPGIYDEQVVIDGKDLTLQGAGDTTVISPSSASQLSSVYTTGTQTGAFFNGIAIAGIIDVRNVGAAGVTIRDLKVDGEAVTSLPAGAGHVSGVVFGETGGLVDNVTVEDTNQVSPASVRTYSMWFDAVGGAPVSVEVGNSRAILYGRNGINGRGDSMTVNFHDNTITGPGMVGPDQVPNGVLLISGAGGEVKDNTVSENHYTGATFLGSGVLLFQARDGIVVSGNEIFDTDDAVIINATDLATVEDNDLRGNVKGVRIEAGSAGNNTVTKNLITSNTLVGIEVSDTAGTANVALRNAITGNTAGVSNLNASNFDATCNWWGNASGPSGSGPGTGDSASANVDFSLWLTTSDLNGTCNGPLPDVTVTIIKYIEDSHATAASAGSASFPMNASWSAVNIGTGSGSFALSTTGFNNPNEYEATTADMTAGASYSTNEDTSGAVVGPACSAGTPFALVGYSWGDSESAAAAMTPTTTSPALTNITSDTFVIVWNEDCSTHLTLEKVVVNDHGGTAVDTDWTLSASGPTPISGSEGDSAVTNAVVTPGTYDLSESGGPATYDASAWVCTGGTQVDGDTVTVAAGEDAVCTITNDDQPGTLIVEKVLINDDGGTRTVTSFRFSIDGGASQSFEFDAQNDVAVSAGTHSVLEDAAPGYITTYSNSQNANADCNGLVIANGGTVTCTITNNDVPPPPANACSLIAPPPGYTLQNGTPGNNTVTLAPFTMFKGNGGRDVVQSNANGNYIVCTLGGNDVIRLSGSGAVTIDAGSGRNSVSVGNMTGFITTGTGDDHISAGSGARTIDAGNGKNTITTGGGDQTITTGSGDDFISTNSGNDTINAGNGKNNVFSKGGNDSVTTGSGKDFIDAGAGSDTCNAGGGTNTVINCAP